MAVMGKEEVLLARIASARAAFDNFANNSFFNCRSSGAASMIVEVLCRPEPLQRLLALRRRAAALLHRAGQRIGDAVERPLGRAGGDVVQLGSITGARRHLRDAGPHRSRADHQHALHVEDADGHHTFPK
jgi:hypothetical protein